MQRWPSRVSTASSYTGGESARGATNYVLVITVAIRGSSCSSKVQQPLVRDLQHAETNPLLEALTFIPFSPADKYNPLASQTLIVLHGTIDQEDEVSTYTLKIRQPDGCPLNIQMTHQLEDALFGPPISGTPEREEWEAARERRRRELDAS
jgi:hypothetical protein